MRLHIFNPEHDIALAMNMPRFTPPHAGRQMRADLSFLPAIWADDGDMVVVDDVEAAVEAVRHIRKYAHDVLFVTLDDLRNLALDISSAVKIEPWGWDVAVRGQLLRAQPSLQQFLPDDAALAAIRQMSSRQFASEHLLPLLHDANPSVVGESVYCDSEQKTLAMIGQYGKSVLKSPWSCSGRGIRYINTPEPDEHTVGWLRNVIRQQGGIMVEPFYAKVYDFGMEFQSTPDKGIVYSGISLFDTRAGAYTGSICATENDKREMLSQYVDLTLIDNICQQIQTILQPLMNGVYYGPFGIDMMAVAKNSGSGFLLHPCVELNLRRTMGHVALALSPSEFEPRRIMSIYYSDKHRIRIQNTMDNLLNTGLV